MLHAKRTTERATEGRECPFWAALISALILFAMGALLLIPEAAQAKPGGGGTETQEFSVEPQLDTNGDNVTVSHHITENSPARIGKIAIRGNFKTHDWVILSEMKLKEGQRLTVAAAEAAQQNLRQSGLFATAQVNFIYRCEPAETSRTFQPVAGSSAQLKGKKEHSQV